MGKKVKSIVIFLLIIFFIFLPNLSIIFAATPGTPQWANAPTVAPNFSFYNAVTTDSSGNVFVAGDFDGNVAYNLGNSVTVTGGNTSTNGVLIKYSAAGVAQWAKTAVTAPDYTHFINVSTDSSGNIYVAGYFAGNGVFDFGNGVTINGPNHTPSNIPNAIIVKYNSSGVAQWAAGPVVSPASAEWLGIASDSSGNTYVAGYFAGNQTYDFGNSVTITTPNNTNNAVVAKYNSSGVAQWAKTPTTATNNSDFSGVSLDTSGNVYISGQFQGSASFDMGNGVTVTGANASFNAGVVKYNSSGVTQWAKSTVTATGTSNFHGVSVDYSGNVYLAGEIYAAGTLGFGNSVTVTGLSASGNSLIVKYDTNGVAQWAKAPTTSPARSAFQNISVDTSGTSYAAGLVNNTGTFDFGNSVTLTGAYAGNTIALVAYDISGTPQWAKTFTVAPDFSYYNNAYVDSSGNVFAVGEIDNGTFNLGSGITVAGNYVSGNGVIAKYAGVTPTIPATATPAPTAAPPGSTTNPPPNCNNPPPPYAPVLFAATRKNTVATLSFTPVNVNSTGYTIMYGYAPGDDRFSVSFNLGYSPGSIVYQIGGLNPKYSYYFKVRAKNDCVPGPWSNYLSVPNVSGGFRTPAPTKTPRATATPSESPTASPNIIAGATPTSTPSAEITLPLAGLIDFVNRVIDPVITLVNAESAKIVSDVGALIENRSTENAAAVARDATDVGVSAGVTVIAVKVIVGTAVTSGVVADTLAPVYAETKRPGAIFPFDLAKSLMIGFGESITTFFAPVFGFLSKRKSKQGAVFDGLSGGGLAGAYLILYSPSGNLKTTFTDDLGLYSLSPPPDIYSLRAHKSDFFFPSKLVTVSANDLYNHIYLPGEKIEVKKEGETVNNVAVPLDPDTNIPAFRQGLIRIWHNISFVTRRFRPVLEVLSLLITGFAAYFSLNPFYKTVFAVLVFLYVFDFARRLTRKGV